MNDHPIFSPHNPSASVSQILTGIMDVLFNFCHCDKILERNNLKENLNSRFQRLESRVSWFHHFCAQGKEKREHNGAKLLKPCIR